MMAKRYKKQNAEWVVVFDDASALRSVVDAVSAVMNRVTFRIVRTEDGQHELRFDGADPGMSCVVSARLHVDTVEFSAQGDADDFTFCLECKQLIVALDNPSCAHGTMRIEGFEDKVRVVMQDPDHPSYKDESELQTYVDDQKPIQPLDMKMEIEIELEISKIREMLKKARKSHAEKLRIQVYFKEENTPPLSAVRLSVVGETNAYHAQNFCNELRRSEDGSLAVTAASDGAYEYFETCHLEPAFEGSFPVDKIDAFVKILPVRMVPVQVQNKLPLMMTHQLGGGVLGGDRAKSSIRFLIAPIIEDE